MDPEDLAKLVEEMRKTKVTSEDKVKLGSDIVKRETDRIQGCLLAKVFSNKPIHRDTFKQQMPKILQTSKPVEIESVGENLFIMEFRSIVDKRRTLTEGPWNFHRNLVLFQEIQGLQNPRSVTFEKIDIWVQLHNLPIAFMNRNILEMIGSKIGLILEIDEGEGGNFWGRFARIRVRIDLGKPLKKFVSVQVEQEKDEVIVLLVYERLPDYCYACGRIGHVHKDCTEEETNKDEFQFGPWLKATSHTSSRRSREDKKTPVHASVSGASTSNRNVSTSKDKGEDVSRSQEDDKNDRLQEKTDLEEVLSSGAGAEQLPISSPMKGVESSDKNQMGKEILMEDNPKTPKCSLLRLTNGGEQHGPSIQKLEQTKEIYSIQLAMDLSSSAETTTSTGRSPSKWKERARARRIINQGCAHDTSTGARKKRKFNAEMSHIDCIVNEGSKVWRFTGFYGNPEASLRKFSWDLLKRLSNIQELKELPWLVGGDFNEICFDSEKKGGRLRANSHMEAMREAMEFCEPRNMHAKGEFFTWVGRQKGETPIFERLDRFVHSEGWRHLYPTALATNLEFYHSDHRPVEVFLGPLNRGWGIDKHQAKSSFKFEACYLSEDDIELIVEKGWATVLGGCSLVERIKICGEYISQWAGTKFRRLSKIIAVKRKQLNALKRHEVWEKSAPQIAELEKGIEKLTYRRKATGNREAETYGLH
ncbi:hypothetical protein DH2020_002868 [Rehmannia glutinosa]|uniref:CCHC-type domain-containing protein n=1 Tax=Rehmannia glutinosa TaxID=99300 RepID=A0ABR0XUY6_REHGL